MVTQRPGPAAAGAENVLGGDPRPVFFAVDRPDALGLDPPPPGDGETVRVWARLLSGMQKEAIVCSTAGGVWRLASDEGPYLDGFDAAPCPLAFMTVGMVSSWMNAVLDAARARGLTVRDLVLVQDNRYTMEGSALNGTMTGGVLPVELEVRIDADAGEDTVRELVAEATRGATVYDVLRRPHVSRFTLAVNGVEAQVDRAARLDVDREADPAPAFSRLAPADPDGVPVVAALSVMFDAQRSADADADSGFRFGIGTVSAWGEDDCPPEQQQCDEDDGVDDPNDGGGGGGGGGGGYSECHICRYDADQPNTISCGPARSGESGGTRGCNFSWVLTEGELSLRCEETGSPCTG